MYQACRQCCINQMYRICDVLNASPEVRERVLARGMEVLDGFDTADDLHDSAMGFGLVWNAISPILGTRDLYHAEKRHHNELALSMLDRAREAVTSSPVPLRQALAFAAAGNLIDFAPGHDLGDDQMERVVQDALTLRFAIDDSEELVERLSASRSVAYIVDNCGEVVFDRVLIEELLRQNPSRAVTVIVRNGPIINDVTMDEAEQVGLTELCRVIPSGDPHAPAGNVMRNISEEARRAILDADVVISKGQGNFEGMRGERHPGLYFVLRAKCDVMSRACGCQMMDLVCASARRYVAA